MARVEAPPVTNHPSELAYDGNTLSPSRCTHCCPEVILTGSGALVIGVAFTLLALVVNSATAFCARTALAE